jgi:hypothetical protein
VSRASTALSCETGTTRTTMGAGDGVLPGPSRPAILRRRGRRRRLQHAGAGREAR